MCFTKRSFENTIVQHAVHFRELTIHSCLRDLRNETSLEFIANGIGQCINLRNLNISFLKCIRDVSFTKDYNSDFSIASVYSDHDFVFLELNLHKVNRRVPGTWKFNNSLLQEESFCSAVVHLIEHFLHFRSSFPSDIVMGDLFKRRN